MHQLDVRLTFLKGPLEEEVCVKKSHVFELEDQEKKLFILRKTLYGLSMLLDLRTNELIPSYQVGFTKCA